MTPKGADLEATDLIEVSTIESGSYVTRSITGQELIDAIPLPPTGLTVGTTPIASGTIGRVLFQGTGNVLQQSSSLFWDSTNNRLGIGTSSPSAIIHSVGSVTASGAIARSNYLNNTLVAAANSDVLVGLDIQPTFTNGAFTGVDNFSLRINGGKGVIGTTANSGVFPLIVRQSNYSGLLVQNSFTGTNHNSSYDGFAFWTNNDSSFAKSLITNWDNNGIYIYNSGVSPTGLVLFGTTNNLGLNTTTDAGFRLDVNGTARVQGSTTIAASSNFGLNITRSGTSGIAEQIYNSAGTTYLGADSSAGAFLFTNGLPYASFFGNGANYPTQFGTNGAIRMTIFAGGNVGINTTTDAGFKLDVNGTARVNGNLTADNVNVNTVRASAFNNSNNTQTVFFSSAFTNTARFAGAVSMGTTSEPLASAQLDVNSTTRGFLPPRMTTTQKNAIASPATGLQVFDTTLNQMSYYNGTTWTNI